MIATDAAECSSSWMPYDRRLLPVRDIGGALRTVCPACSAVVEIVAAPDGGPGGVYEPHAPAVVAGGELAR